MSVRILIEGATSAINNTLVDLSNSVFDESAGGFAILSEPEIAFRDLLVDDLAKHTAHDHRARYDALVRMNNNIVAELQTWSYYNGKLTRLANPVTEPKIAPKVSVKK